MKKALFLLATLAIMFMANMNVKAQCEPGWTQVSQLLNYNGCSILYIYCYGMLNGLHCMSLVSINVISSTVPPCDGSVYDNNKEEINDLILIEIGKYLESDEVNFFGEKIPQCPNGMMCLLVISDAICYNGWSENAGIYFMNRCDNVRRSCNSTLTYCYEWVNGVKVYRVTRAGSMIGPPCPKNCSSSCK